MKSPTQILSAEHQNILKMIEVLLKKCDDLRAGGDLDKDFLAGALDFIRNYADKFHHAKEENILFKELSKDSVQMRCNPVQQMLYEHDLGRKFVKGMEKGLKKNDRKMIIENASGYAELLQEHIFKEDNILYPMADEVLTQKTQDVIADAFKKVDKKLSAMQRRCLTFLKQWQK